MPQSQDILYNPTAVGAYGFKSATTPGGYTPPSQNVGNNVNWAVGGAPSAGTSGNITSPVAGTLYWTQVYVESNQTLTGLEFLATASTTTDAWLGSLYNNTGGLVAVTALQTVATTAGSVNSFQKIPFTSTYAAVGPAFYYVGLQSTGTTNKFNSYTIPGVAFGAGSLAGTTATQPALATATLALYVNNVGPISCTY